MAGRAVVSAFLEGGNEICSHKNQNFSKKEVKKWNLGQNDKEQYRVVRKRELWADPKHRKGGRRSDTAPDCFLYLP